VRSDLHAGTNNGTSQTSHTAFTTNQNWSGSTFPTPFNTGSFITLAILLLGGGGGGMGKDRVEVGETGDGVGGVDMRRILCLISLIALPGETFVSSSLPPRGSEIKELVSSSMLPLFV